MANINTNIIMQAGAAVANATNKAAGLSASTPEPGTIISAIQLVNGGRTIGPDALAHFTESVRNKLLSLLVSMEPIQSGSGTPSPDNVRPISGRTGLSVYVSPTTSQADATTYSVDWTTQAGTVYGCTLDVVTGVLTVDRACTNLSTSWYWFIGSSQPSGKTVVATTNFPAHKGNIAICSHYKRSSTSYIVDMKNGEFLLSDGGTGAFFCFKNEAGGTPQEFKDIIAAQEAAGSPIQVCYELATPLTYQLTPQDIITLVGDNCIWSDSGDVTITE